MEVITPFLLPGALVAAWVVLWWRGSRRARLWFAALSVAGVIAACLLGTDMVKAAPGSPTSGGDDGAYWARSLASVPDDAVLVAVNAVLGLIVAVPLAAITALVELLRPARTQPRPDPRRERAADALEEWGRDNGYL
ncbi:hypothetical protein [Actinoplanes sp. URMC 104]|uniref:hypothetical protein n=1 Tax=Actinoplanes sp. URMC 104 TaxID=3423409 RepID=UPI003F1BA760